jgi:hypothetical protein
MRVPAHDRRDHLGLEVPPLEQRRQESRCRLVHRLLEKGLFRQSRTGFCSKNGEPTITEMRISIKPGG